MSDLSRLRARWIRLEKRIAALDKEIADADEELDDVAKMVEKRTASQERLEETIKLVGIEEKRLFAADSMLRFTGV